MLRLSVFSPLVIFLLLAFTACNNSEGAGSTSETASSELTQEQIEKGIGPVQNVKLDAIDPSLVASGEEIFNMKCTACHKLDTRYVGPPLGDVTERRAPEYVMNMMLNPAEMVQKHPVAKDLLAQYMTPMPDQNLTEDEARAVLEFLRDANAQ